MFFSLCKLFAYLSNPFVKYVTSSEEDGISYFWRQVVDHEVSNWTFPSPVTLPGRPKRFIRIVEKIAKSTASFFLSASYWSLTLWCLSVTRRSTDHMNRPPITFPWQSQLSHNLAYIYTLMEIKYLIDLIANAWTDSMLPFVAKYFSPFKMKCKSYYNMELYIYIFETQSLSPESC